MTKSNPKVGQRIRTKEGIGIVHKILNRDVLLAKTKNGRIYRMVRKAAFSDQHYSGDKSEAYDEGWDAGTNCAFGRRYERCPYRTGSQESDDWEDGFNDAGLES